MYLNLEAKASAHAQPRPTHERQSSPLDSDGLVDIQSAHGRQSTGSPTTSRPPPSRKGKGKAPPATPRSAPAPAAARLTTPASGSPQRGGRHGRLSKQTAGDVATHAFMKAVATSKGWTQAAEDEDGIKVIHDSTAGKTLCGRAFTDDATEGSGADKVPLYQVHPELPAKVVAALDKVTLKRREYLFPELELAANGRLPPLPSPITTEAELRAEVTRLGVDTSKFDVLVSGKPAAVLFNEPTITPALALAKCAQKYDGTAWPTGNNSQNSKAVNTFGNEFSSIAQFLFVPGGFQFNLEVNREAINTLARVLMRNIPQLRLCVFDGGMKKAYAFIACMYDLRRAGKLVGGWSAHFNLAYWLAKKDADAARLAVKREKGLGGDDGEEGEDFGGEENPMGEVEVVEETPAKRISGGGGRNGAKARASLSRNTTATDLSTPTQSRLPATVPIPPASQQPAQLAQGPPTAT